MNEVYWNLTDPNFHKKIKSKDLKQKLTGRWNLKKARRKQKRGRGEKIDFWMCNQGYQCSDSLMLRTFSKRLHKILWLSKIMATQAQTCFSFLSHSARTMGRRKNTVSSGSFLSLLSYWCPRLESTSGALAALLHCPVKPEPHRILLDGV